MTASAQGGCAVPAMSPPNAVMASSPSIALRGLAVAATLLALAGCGGRSDRAPVVYRGSEPQASGAYDASPGVAAPAAPVAVAALPPPRADSGGVIDYGGYRAVVARPGDTVESMAARGGVSASALAAYNGLPSNHAPKAGDELILPPEATATGGPPPTAAPVEITAPLSPPVDPAASAAVQPPPAPEAVPAVAAPPPSTGFDLDRIEAAIDEPTPAAPSPEPAPAVAEPPPPDQTSAVAVVEPTAPSAPAPTGSTSRFLPPVDGPISRPYSRDAGTGRNDGVDFSAPAGAPVRAAAPGQVALVSESLGGLGTIVLIRHGEDLLTVYGRVDGVTVQRGDTVSAGDVIGAVAPGAEGGDPALHFEVRRGADSVDPADFL